RLRRMVARIGGVLAGASAVPTDGPLTQLRYGPSARASLPSPTRGEGVPTAAFGVRLKPRLLGLLPLWEKVAEGRMRGGAVGIGLAAACVLAALATPAFAETIANPVAAFSGLDKITGRITKFDVYVDETVQFGALQITPRVCYTRPPTETQRTSVFVEVDQVCLNGQISRIFTGWMFADSLALHAIDHAV